MTGSFLAVVDLLLDDVPVAIEFDGFVKYSRPDPFATASTPADVLFAEKVREDHVRGLRYAMVRAIWRELTTSWSCDGESCRPSDLARALRAA